MELRTIRPGEVDAYLEATAAAFHGDLRPDQRERWSAGLEPERSVAAFDGAQVVGTASAFTRAMSVPGGALVPAAHVTMVGVLPTHRRRGLLRAMLDEVHGTADEPFAVLWASEAPIYGRFGYGPAARYAELSVATPRAALRHDAPPAAPVRLHAPADVRGRLEEVHRAVLGVVPGMPDRTSPAWWDRRLADPEAERDGASALRAALLEDGRGYALFAVKQRWGADGPDGVCVVHELMALDAAARAALWRFLLSLDLVRRVEWDGAPADEPLPHLLADPRAVSARVRDALWVKLLDVPRALAARTCAAPLDVVLDVGDEGPVRLRAGADGDVACDPAPHAAPDVRLGAEALGAAFLGGTTLLELHAAGRVQELRPGAVAAASRALRADAEPWCPELF